ncbi:hypothetical protein SAMN05421812_106430 [Asanoa hainanensis]|uniref:Uncharacterized protein n=1 Tax=Asanoa hainanensis TaxID=560556 RepID=A0A239MYA9_9ACTN|nr:hypothetical protein [Asanoa hainanensis]SNT46849.1 hypothetical protein SAMN05421812_106430 [Asanoa hainanensis]
MSEVDFDLLADYVGGALDGTPEHERVAALVATDPGWAREHDLLVAALSATADDLATFAEQTAEPMPEEVLTRLLAALPAPAAAESDRAAASDHAAASDRAAASDHTAAADHVPAGPRGRRAESRGRRGGARPAGRPLRHRPRWLAWAAPALVAVAVAAFAGFWISQSVGSGTTATQSAGGAADTAAQAPNAAGGDAATLAIPRFATGQDYTGDAVARGLAAGSARASVKALQSPGVMSAEGDQPEGASAKAVEPELFRLNGAAALAVCVDAIAQAHGQGPITVSAADFSSYQGRPAVIVFFTDSAGVRWGWAVGPDCGPGGTDELFRTRVG